MKRSDLNAKLRTYVRENLSPREHERTFVTAVYASICDLLGEANCLQIGSYPRYTAITPMHDLDVLFILGPSIGTSPDPSVALHELRRRLEADYQNPTTHEVSISSQTHSVTLKFLEGDDEAFAVDIVPAYRQGQNEFGDDMYLVPEIATATRADRRRIATEVAEGRHAMAWIRSDPRGYITVAARTNEANADFRRSVKLVKGWRHSCKELDENFPLKSFHLEQILTCEFLRSPEMDLFDATFDFFRELPSRLNRPIIPDRADPEKFIDAYIADLTDNEKRKIRKARDFFLIQLEEFTEDTDVEDLLAADLYERASSAETYLFDQGIPMLNEQDFSIIGEVQPRDGGFRAYLLDAIGVIQVDRKIKFRLGKNAPEADLYKWKVKNDNGCTEPRGEITDGHTRNDPEHTKYNGEHYVECFAIKNRICIGRSRQNVVLHRSFG